MLFLSAEISVILIAVLLGYAVLVLTGIKKGIDLLLSFATVYYYENGERAKENENADKEEEKL